MQKTMICLILDRSGSMQGLEKDVIGGVNKFLEDQKKLPDPAYFCAVRFDGATGGSWNLPAQRIGVLGGIGSLIAPASSACVETFITMKRLEEVRELTSADFIPRGSTPLFDAIGETINQLDHDWQEIQPDRCIVVIYTDGAENASTKFTKTKVREMINARQGSDKWTFLFLGANIDASAEGSSLGIHAQNSVNYTNTEKGLQTAYGSVSATVSVMRATGSTTAGWNGGSLGEGETKKQEKSTS